MYFKGTGESTLVMDSPVPLMHHDPDRSWITDPDPDHPKGTQPETALTDFFPTSTLLADFCEVHDYSFCTFRKSFHTPGIFPSSLNLLGLSVIFFFRCDV